MASLTSIAQNLLAQAKIIDAWVKAEGLSPVSFDDDILKNLPTHLQGAREELINGGTDLTNLARGPESVSINIIMNVSV
jgi:hypothetical protein